jgi:hypothetical protein
MQGVALDGGRELELVRQGHALLAWARVRETFDTATGSASVLRRYIESGAGSGGADMERGHRGVHAGHPVG